MVPIVVVVVNEAFLTVMTAREESAEVMRVMIGELKENLSLPLLEEMIEIETLVIDVDLLEDSVIEIETLEIVVDPLEDMVVIDEEEAMTDLVTMTIIQKVKTNNTKNAEREMNIKIVHPERTEKVEEEVMKEEDMIEMVTDEVAMKEEIGMVTDEVAMKDEVDTIVIMIVMPPKKERNWSLSLVPTLKVPLDPHPQKVPKNPIPLVKPSQEMNLPI